MPSLKTVSKIVPTMWNAEFSLGPASITHTRTRSSGSTRIGRVQVLVHVAVEHHGVDVFVLHLGEVTGLALGSGVDLGLHEHVLVVDRARGPAGR